MTGSTDDDPLTDGDPSAVSRRNPPTLTHPSTETEKFPTTIFFQKRRKFFGFRRPASIRRNPVLLDPFRRDQNPTEPDPPLWPAGRRPDVAGQCCRPLKRGAVMTSSALQRSLAFCILCYSQADVLQ